MDSSITLALAVGLFGGLLSILVVFIIYWWIKRLIFD